MVYSSAQLALAVVCVLLIVLVVFLAAPTPMREHIGSRHVAHRSAPSELRFGLPRGEPASGFPHEGGNIGEPAPFAISMAGPPREEQGFSQDLPSPFDRVRPPTPFHPPAPFHPPKPLHPVTPPHPVTPLTPLGPAPITPTPSPLTPQTPAAPDVPPPPPGWDIGGGFSILAGQDRAKKIARGAPRPKHISVLEKQSHLGKLALPPWWQRSFGGYPWWHWYWYYPRYALKLVKDEPTYCSWCRQCLAGGGGDACESCLDHCGGQPQFYSLGE